MYIYIYACYVNRAHFISLKKKFNKSLVPLWIEIFHSNLLCPLIYSCKLIRRIVISLQNQILVRFLWWHDGWKRKRVSLLICYLFAEKISRRKVGNDAQLIHYRLHKLRKKKKKKIKTRDISSLDFSSSRQQKTEMWRHVYLAPGFRSFSLYILSHKFSHEYRSIVLQYT